MVWPDYRKSKWMIPFLSKRIEHNKLPANSYILNSLIRNLHVYSMKSHFDFRLLCWPPISLLDYGYTVKQTHFQSRSVSISSDRFDFGVVCAFTEPNLYQFCNIAPKLIFSSVHNVKISRAWYKHIAVATAEVLPTNQLWSHPPFGLYKCLTSIGEGQQVQTFHIPHGVIQMIHSCFMCTFKPDVILPECCSAIIIT